MACCQAKKKYLSTYLNFRGAMNRSDIFSSLNKLKDMDIKSNYSGPGLKAEYIKEPT